MTSLPSIDIYGLFKMVFNFLWVILDVFEVVVEFFEVLELGCKSFLLLVTTQNEVNNCGKVTLDGR